MYFPGEEDAHADVEMRVNRGQILGSRLKQRDESDLPGQKNQTYFSL